jgi:hypothetical protein
LAASAAWIAAVWSTSAATAGVVSTFVIIGVVEGGSERVAEPEAGLPLGKAARATRAVSSGTSGTGLGFRDTDAPRGGGVAV